MESIIFFNGDIITMENKEDKPEAILVENGVITNSNGFGTMTSIINGSIPSIPDVIACIFVVPGVLAVTI